MWSLQRQIQFKFSTQDSVYEEHDRNLPVSFFLYLLQVTSFI